MRRTTVLAVLCLLALSLASADAYAQRARRSGTSSQGGWQRPPVELSATYGSLFGGNIDFIGGRIRMGTGPSLGLILDIPIRPGTYAELAYTRQDGSLDLDRGTTTTLSDMSVNFWHLGATQLLSDGKVQPFIITGIGATYFSPKEASFEVDGDTFRLESTTKLSFALGLGLKTFFGENERIGLRASFKMLPTMYNTGAGIFVGTGGVSAGVSGNAIWQWEGAAGLTVRFGG